MVGRPSKPTTTKTKASTRWIKGRAPIANKQRANAVLNRAEVKFFDTTLNFTADATAEVPATGQLALITQGTGSSNREGYLVTIKSLHVRGLAVQAPATGATSATNLIIHVMQDVQANGAAATQAEMVNSTNLAIAMPIVPNQYRFKTLKRIVVPLTATAGVTTAYNNNSKTFDEYIKFAKPIQIRYNGNAGTVADIVTNNLFLLAGSDAQSDDTITVVGQVRLRFTG